VHILDYFNSAVSKMCIVALVNVYVFYGHIHYIVIIMNMLMEHMNV